MHCASVMKTSSPHTALGEASPSSRASFTSTPPSQSTGAEIGAAGITGGMHHDAVSKLAGGRKAVPSLGHGKGGSNRLGARNGGGGGNGGSRKGGARTGIWQGGSGKLPVASASNWLKFPPTLTLGMSI